MTIPRQTIRRDTRVFISAVTRELGLIRKLVKKGLEDNDYHVVEQDNFPPDYRDLIDKLRERIDSCDAVVQIAGHCYGAEPGQQPPVAPRWSYTQFEYEIAIELDNHPDVAIRLNNLASLLEEANLHCLPHRLARGTARIARGGCTTAATGPRT